MMRRLTVGPWTLEVDLEATESAYAEIADGTEECDCDHCQHWAAHRDDTISVPIREFLSTLGIDYRREGEVYELDPRPSSHSCAGWYHFIGRIASGPRPVVHWDTPKSGTVEMPDGAPIAPGFDVTPHDTDIPPMKPAIRTAYERGEPIVTVEFTSTLHRIDH